MSIRTYHECDAPGCAVAVATPTPDFNRGGTTTPPVGWLVLVGEFGTDWPTFCTPVCAALYIDKGEK